MKLFRRIALPLMAILLLGTFCAADGSAFPRRRVYTSPGVTYYPYAEPAAGIGMAYVPLTVYQGPGVPIYNPYVAPYPAYGILPPPFATINMLYGQTSPYSGQDLMREPLEYTPRKRPSAYPAVPFDKVPEDRLAEQRRVRFEITVPTEDAIVLFDGAETKQTGLKRSFKTPPLTEDRLYEFTIEVRWTDAAGKRKSAVEPRKFLAGERISLTIK